MLLQEDLNSPCTEEIARIQASLALFKRAGEKICRDGHRSTGHTVYLMQQAPITVRCLDKWVVVAKPLTPMMQLRTHNKQKC